MTEITKIQRLVCSEFNAEFVSSPEDMKVGISRNVKQGVIPINGLRYSPEGDTTGWYIWGGDEFSEEPDFFVPLHVCCASMKPDTNLGGIITTQTEVFYDKTTSLFFSRV